MSLVTFALLAMRRPDALLHPQFWAEDGTVFFYEQVVHGAAAVFLPHAGYLHSVARLVATLASAFPVAFAPFMYNVCALMIGAWCCALFSSRAYSFLIASDSIRAALCIACAAVPFADELLGTITNVQWFLSLGALLLIAARPQSNAVVRSAIVILFALSAPQVVIFTPLALWYALRRVGPDKAPAIALLIGAAIQVCVFLTHPEEGATGFHAIPILAATVDAWAIRVVLSTVVGHVRAQSIATTAPLLAIALSAALLVTLLAIARSSPARFRNALIAAGIMLGAVTLAMSFRGSATAFATPWAITEWRGERYFWLSSVLLLFLFACAIEAVRGRYRPVLGAAFVVVVALGVAGNGSIPAFADEHWDVYAPAIASWRGAHETRHAAPTLSVPVNPEPWRFVLPAEGGPSGTPYFIGELIRKPGDDPESGKVFFVTRDGKRHWVISAAWITKHGMRWPGDVKTIAAEDLERIPLGEPIEP